MDRDNSELRGIQEPVSYDSSLQDHSPVNSSENGVSSLSENFLANTVDLDSAGTEITLGNAIEEENSKEDIKLNRSNRSECIRIEASVNSREKNHAAKSANKRSRKKISRAPVLIVMFSIVVITSIVITFAYRNNQYRSYQEKIEAVNNATPNFTPQIVPLATSIPSVSLQKITSVIAKLTANPTLGAVGIEIADAHSGKILWSKNAFAPLVPASTLKLLTATAALLTLPLDHRIATTVVIGDAPGTIVLVGNGDPTLSTLGRHQGFYPDAPRMIDLAGQILRTYQQNITKIIVDESFFSGKTLAPSWMKEDIPNGDITPIVPTMVDGGRLDPTYESARAYNPGIIAGRALARALHLPVNTRIEIGSAPAGSKILATVYSAPLLERLRQMLLMSDNVMAEELSLEVAGATGNPLTFDGGIKSVHDTLTNSGIDIQSVMMADTNGLSHVDRISAHDLNTVLLAATKDDLRYKQLRLLLNLLPVSGKTGTLIHRFSGKNHSAAGHVRAKTGSLNGVNTLAGVVITKDLTALSFALLSNNPHTYYGDVSDQFDAIVTALFDCDCSQ